LGDGLLKELHVYRELFGIIDVKLQCNECLGGSLSTTICFLCSDIYTSFLPGI
jgi:hypothetical protein